MTPARIKRAVHGCLQRLGFAPGVRNAVGKALRGERLGSRQQEAARQMLEEIQVSRTGFEGQYGRAYDGWQDMLSEFRDMRRAARGQLSDQQIDGGEIDTLSQTNLERASKPRPTRWPACLSRAGSITRPRSRMRCSMSWPPQTRRQSAPFGN